ncbi:MAG: SAM-dependent methyltransferase [Chromatiales bacterium]|jgi:ubiquinone/menaquinone biosynthesis C-methylase UbiE|nr:SAM-dependent methyltransferase [Chromatiales bacterium]MDP6150307.1 class I SAM-dependent methyltransferase [Gammaproteobacteria bacterium]MDP7094374.1 class I SAM-dependent methyltransferase [Gammaproteobacteria bacterium]MDP7269965.1 class I SAM-dependent methyltransferase [Gammaproteobacteria bacterium]HJP05487.1 class I SAM-dependent methyltransferase [Gammaproteobacteria bacterium]
MGIWNDKVLPRLIDRGMRREALEEHRYRAAPLATGRVLELGVGSGLNFPHYGDAVEHLFALEPSEHLRAVAEEPAAEVTFGVDFLDASAEAIPLDTGEIDTVVSSWTLCSIPDLESSLQEIRRVLKPAGKLVFIEHGRSPDPRVAGWQDRLVPLSTRLLGCSLNRPMDTLIKDAGFNMLELETNYLEGPKLLAYHYIGRARPA